MEASTIWRTSLRIVVIGAGILGAAVAASLTRRGAQVTILEAEHPGSGTTATTFAWVNSANKDPDSYFALNHAGVRAHHEFAGQRATRGSSPPAIWNGR